MDSTINQRIKAVIDDSGLTLSSFSRLIGIAQTSLRDCVVKNSEPKFSTLDKVIKANPLINPEWLLTGIGQMKKGEDSGPDINPDLPPVPMVSVDGSKEERMLSVIQSQQRTIEKLTDLALNLKR